MHDIMLDRLIKFLGPPGESEDCEAVCQLIEKKHRDSGQQCPTLLLWAQDAALRSVRPREKQLTVGQFRTVTQGRMPHEPHPPDPQS